MLPLSTFLALINYYHLLQTYVCNQRDLGDERYAVEGDTFKADIKSPCSQFYPHTLFIAPISYPVKLLKPPPSSPLTRKEVQSKLSIHVLYISLICLFLDSESNMQSVLSAQLVSLNSRPTRQQTCI